MKVKPETYRRFNDLFSSLSDNSAEYLLSDYGIDKDTVDKDRFNEISKSNGENWSPKKFKELWRKAELAKFFGSWLKIYQVKKMSIDFSQFTSVMDILNNKPNSMIIQELVEDPKILYFANLTSNFRGNMGKASTPDSYRDGFYYLPKTGIVLFDTHDDENEDKLKKFLEENLTGKFTPFRTKSMVISKFFRETKIVNQLNVSAIFEITGFAGFDEIRFKGPHVHQGLYGLNKRQDIRVNLNQIGPNIEVSSDNLHLKIGAKIMVKSIDGISDLQSLIES